MKDTVCVTGASGGLGHALLGILLEQYRVKALFRRQTGAAEAWRERGCTAVWGDLSDERALDELVRDTRYVFHCAALVTHASYADSSAVNVNGTVNLALAAARSGCHRFVHVSSSAVYTGSAPPGDYTEDVPLSDSEDMPVYARTKLQAEFALRKVADECGIEYTILRPTFIYGPHTKSYTEVPLALIGKGLPVMVGEGSGILDAVYVDDAAAALVLAAESAEAAGEVFNIGHQPISYREFYGYYAAMLNRPSRRIPLALVKSVHTALGAFRRAGRWQRGARFLIDAAQNTKLYPSRKAEEVLGYAPRFGLAIGMLKTELWARREGRVPARDHALDFYGPLPFRPMAVAHPKDENEIVQILQAAAATNTKVRAIGSLHSQCDLPHTDGICVVLDQYRAVARVEGSLVTVQSGIKLRNLNAALAKLNLALPTLGAIAEQTVAGAISTATHGGSLYHGSLSDCVEGLRIVKADGSVVELDRTDARFPAAIVSLGALGVISTVTFRCVPAFHLRSASSVGKATDVFRDFQKIHTNNIYVDMLYFAATDDVEILTINPVDAAEIDSSATERAPGQDPSRGYRAGLRRQLQVLILRGVASLMRSNTAVQREVTRRSVGRSYRPRSGRSDLVLAFGDNPAAGRFPGIVGDMELAISYSDAGPALNVLRELFRRGGKPPLLPIHIRCSAASTAWMSPAYQRDVCWIEVCSYPRTDTLFAQVHSVLEAFRYRAHWGKEIVANREHLQQQYERWDDFARLRQSWDPRGMLLNDYLTRFFGAGRSAGKSSD